jgi:hypothetical protein
MSVSRLFYRAPTGLVSKGDATIVTPPPPVNPTSVIVTRARGLATYTSGGGTPTTPWTPPADATWAALPSQAGVNFTSFYNTGDSLRTVLTKIQNSLVAAGTGAAGYKQVDLPDGFDMEFTDFPMATTNKYGLFFDRILGFRSPGWNKARIRLAPMSSTVGSEGTGVRLADSRTVQPLGLVPLNYGITWEGTDQPFQTYPQGSGEQGPQLYSGFIQYYGRGAINQACRYRGFSQGNWNSPPGEKFTINDYHGIGNIWRGCEVDGFNVQGKRRGASPFGGNNANGSILEDCYFHDAYVSGTTWSFAGNYGSSSAASSNPTTRRCRFENNANWSNTPGAANFSGVTDIINYNTGGKRFGGLNHEEVLGSIRHFSPTFIVAEGSASWLSCHVSLTNTMVDNGADTWFINPTWNSLDPKYNGMFMVGAPTGYAGVANLSIYATPPLVKLGANADGTGGTTLTPIVHTRSGGPATPYTQSPSTHYIFMRV